MPAYHPLRLVIVSDDQNVQDGVAQTFGSPHRLIPLSFENLGGTGSATLPEPAVQGTDAVLVEWDPLNAPTISSLAYRLHGERVPVIALGGRETSEHAASLAAGVDRYHPLPLSEFLLRAQIIAHRRSTSAPDFRRGPSRPEWAPDSRVGIGPLIVDWSERRARIEGAPVELTPRQFEVLAFFAARVGHLVSRDTLLESVWGFQFDPSTNVVDVYVHHIRRVLAAQATGLNIETVRGRGYRLTTSQGWPAVLG